MGFIRMNWFTLFCGIAATSGSSLIGATPLALTLPDEFSRWNLAFKAKKSHYMDNREDKETVTTLAGIPAMHGLPFSIRRSNGT